MRFIYFLLEEEREKVIASSPVGQLEQLIHRRGGMAGREIFGLRPIELIMGLGVDEQSVTRKMYRFAFAFDSDAQICRAD